MFIMESTNCFPLRWCSSSVMIFITFFSYYYFTKSIAATYKITIRLNRSWEELLSAKVSQLSKSYKPNYKEQEIDLLGTFLLSMKDHIHLKLDINAYLQ